MIIGIAIILTLTIFTLSVVLAWVAYQQTLLINEINKRLMVLSSDAMNNTQTNVDELISRIQDFETIATRKGDQSTFDGDDADINTNTAEDNAFTPHGTLDQYESKGR